MNSVLQSPGFINCCPGSQQEAERTLVLPNTGKVSALSLSLPICQIVIVIPAAGPQMSALILLTQVTKLGRGETGRTVIAEDRCEGEGQGRRQECARAWHSCFTIHFHTHGLCDSAQASNIHITVTITTLPCADSILQEKRLRLRYT